MFALIWIFPFQNNEQLCVVRCLLKIDQSELVTYSWGNQNPLTGSNVGNVKNFSLKWIFPIQNNEQLCVGRCLSKIGQWEIHILGKTRIHYFRGVHKLRLQELAFFDHLPPSVYIFYGIKVYKKSIFWPPTPLLL